MKRAIIFSSATAAGLAGVLAFHTAPVSLGISSVNSAGAAGGGTSTTTPPTTTPPTTTPPTTTPPTTVGSSGTTAPKSKKKPAATTSTTIKSTTTTNAPATTTTSAAASGVRSAVGESVNYYFGVLSVKVTATGKKIDSVTIGQINDGGNYRSQQLDQMSIPILEQETMQAQNSQIQSVSGASYTSAGFVMSLQSALKKLGI